MTNTKSTKRALLASVMAMLLCFTMLLGTTFAWFTDSVTSGGNKIVAGTLDVKLLMDADVDGTYDDISNSTSPIFGEGSIAQNNNAATLWEPGKTQVAYLAIRNDGNLDLKYTVGLNVQNVSKDLYEVMEYAIVADADKNAPVTSWTSGNSVVESTQSVSGDVALQVGETHYFALVIHMNEDAGSEYMGGQVNFDLTVLATQLNSESDAFGTDYDKDALYPVAEGLYIDNTTGDYVAFTTEGLSSVAALASTDSSITSVTYVTDEGEVEVPVVSDFDAFDSAIDNDNEIVVLTNGDFQMPDGSDTLLQGQELTIVGTEDTVIDVSNVDTNDQFVTGATLVFEGVTLNFNDGSGNIYMGLANTANLIYRDCHITGMQFLYGENVTFENCVIDSSANTGEPHSVWTYGAKNVNFIECDFIYGDRAVNCYKDQDIDGGKQVVNFKNCTFTTTSATSEGAVEINSSAFSVGIEVNMDGCTAPANGDMVFISKWDGTDGAMTTINVNGVKIDNATVDHD